LHTHVVGVGSLAEGRQIKDVPWPKNTLVVTIDRAGQRVIPRGTTQLQALDHCSSSWTRTSKPTHNFCSRGCVADSRRELETVRRRGRRSARLP
ncbi:MAG: hypothetical protein IJI12_07335, partial [Atopobiaceae bacterium]|nr:hypothetical protein [Atopobiaceae bacterium]